MYKLLTTGGDYIGPASLDQLQGLVEYSVVHPNEIATIYSLDGSEVSKDIVLNYSPSKVSAPTFTLASGGGNGFAPCSIDEINSLISRDKAYIRQDTLLRETLSSRTFKALHVDGLNFEIEQLSTHEVQADSGPGFYGIIFGFVLWPLYQLRQHYGLVGIGAWILCLLVGTALGWQLIWYLIDQYQVKNEIPVMRIRIYFIVIGSVLAGGALTYVLVAPTVFFRYLVRKRDREPYEEIHQ